MPTSGNHPPAIRAASLLPTPLTLNGPITVTIDAEDVDRNSLSFRYQWVINGLPITDEQGQQLRPEVLKRGDRVSVEIWPHDGTIEGTSFKVPTVTVANSSPVVSHIALEPDIIIPGVQARVRADIHDADNDLTHVTYRWWKNETLLHEGEGTEFDTTALARGDMLSVEAVVADSSSSGEAIRSAPIRVGNAPPRIVSVPPTTWGQEQFTYQVVAHDRESDVMTFSLETAPSGMTIDRLKGLVTWKLSPGLTGIHKVRILVTDSEGAASFQDFEMNISKPPPSDHA